MLNKNGPTFITRGGPYVISTAPSSTAISVLNIFNQVASSANISIGPSDCDSNRDDRTGKVDSVWKAIDISKFIPGQFRSVLDLFREALSCYQNGAYMASCILCRIVTESLLYIAVNSKYDPQKNELVLNPPKNKKTGKPVLQMRYEELLNGARKYLDPNVENWLKKDMDQNNPETGLIRHSGDVVAHYAEKMLNESIALTSTRPVKFWKDETSTLEILKKTASVIQTVNDKYKSVNGIK